MVINRRNLIRAAATGATVASLPTARAAGGDRSDYDVIVVGGGFAGVTAARDLSLRGRRTLLLEARARLGGRTFTTQFGDHDVDMGGTWVGSSQPFVFSELNRYGIDLVESAAAAATEVIWFDGAQRIKGSFDTYASIYGPAAETFYAAARQQFPRPFEPLFAHPSRSLDAKNALDALEEMSLTPVQLDMMRSFCAINGHSDPARSSYLDQLRWYALGNFDLWNLWDNLSKYRISGGTGKLLEAMHNDSRATSKLGAPVQSVRQSPESVEVITKAGDRYLGKQVIIAVPLNCLVDVDFSPSISQLKIDASRARHTGSGTKVYLKTEGKTPVYFGHGKVGMPLCFTWTEYDDTDSQILCGFGESPELLDINDDDAVLAAFHEYQSDIKGYSAFGYD